MKPDRLYDQTLDEIVLPKTVDQAAVDQIAEHVADVFKEHYQSPAYSRVINDLDRKCVLIKVKVPSLGFRREGAVYCGPETTQESVSEAFGGKGSQAPQERAGEDANTHSVEYKKFNAEQMKDHARALVPGCDPATKKEAQAIIEKHLAE